MRQIFRNASPVARVLLIISICFLLVTCVSLGKRAWRGGTDFSVFLRAGTALCEGEGAGLYERLDERTGWFNCIPPAGMGPFMLLSMMHRVVAAVIWATLNVGVLLLCIHLLKKIYARLANRTDYEATLPFALVLLFLLGAVCIQTGQTSIIFMACWLGYVLVSADQRHALAGFLIALPAAIKLYPILFALPALLRRKRRELAWIGIWMVVLTLVVPGVIFGPGVVDMSQSFVENQILDPGGRAMEAADPKPASNQGLDGVLVRYLSYVPAFHDRHPAFPHLNVEVESVVTIANFLRIIVLIVTIVVSLRWIRTRSPDPPLLLIALWCAALYVILPGAKGRYAVYAFPAFLPVLAAAHGAFRVGDVANGRKAAAVALVAAVLVLQLVPDSFLYYGIGIIGPFLLWHFLLRSASTVRASENHAS